MVNISAALAEAGIVLKSQSTGDHKTVCPRCSHKRKQANRSDPCLSVTVEVDGVVWRCHHCEWTTPVLNSDDPEAKSFFAALFGWDDMPRPSQATSEGSHAPRREKPLPVRPRASQGQMPDEGYEWFKSRGISRPTVDRNGIWIDRTWMPGADGEVSAIAFPYFRDGELLNIKWRTRDKRFRQEKGAEKIFYGLDSVADHDTVVIVEGELDKLALEEAGLHERMGVLSVPDGAPKSAKDTAIDRENDAKFDYVWNGWAVLEKARKVILAVDGDEPGRALAEELSRRIGKAKCWRVEWPSLGDAPRKDANEVLLVDGPEVLRECIDNAKPCPIQNLHNVSDFRDRVLNVYEGGRDRGLSTGWHSLDQHLTIVPGLVSVVTGTPGSGKSEFVDALAMNLAVHHGWRFAICSFENEPGEDHIPKLAEKRMGVPFWDGPTPRMGTYDLGQALDWLEDRFTFIVAGEASPNIDWILEKARDAVTRHGINGLVIDPYNEIEHHRKSGQTESEYISEMLGKVRRFARANGVHVWFVAHPAKLMRDKSGRLPVPSLYDISGSAHWVNKADVGIVVDRQFQEDGRRSKDVQVEIKKIRFRWFGSEGVVTLRYNPATGQYGEVGR